MSVQIHRALIALDARGTPRVLATDSPTIAGDCAELATDCDEIGLLDARDIGPGLWVWVGTVKAVHDGLWDDPPNYVPEYTGEARQVASMDEAAELFAMSVLDSLEDQREE